ncbi:hypothetical protein [Flectobacillus roseus]|uniref:hypothetical protein n=1 Tax=Flectobacillus roseus TaxID=502259 RepID=UPI0024B7F00F|nr:hypothetical protein [Flectobacillus roseus]MDI9872482.1 hypothetical protein [Flectobacillus roseus]
MEFNKKIIATNFSWLLIEKFLKIFGIFAVNILLVPFLSISNYGLLNYGIAINLLIFAGVTSYRDNLLKLLSQDLKLGLDKIVGLTLFRLILIMLFYCLSTLLFENSEVFFIIFGAVVNLTDLPECYWQSQNKMNIPVISKVVVLVIFSILKIYSITVLKSFNTFCLFFFFENVTNTIVSYILLATKINLVKCISLYSFLDTFRFLNASKSLILSNTISVAYLKLDQIMIKQVLGEAVLGYYGLVININELVHAFPFILSTALAPSIFSSSNEDKLLQKFKSLLLNVSIIGLACVVLINILYPLVLYFLHQEWKNVFIMPIVSVGTFVLFQCYLVSKYLVFKGYLRQFLMRSLIATLFAITLNYFLMKHFGIIVCAITFTLNQIFVGLLSNYLLRDNKIFKIQIEAYSNLFKVNSYLDFKNTMLSLLKSRSII